MAGASNHSAITFATGNSASGPTATYFGIGAASSGVGHLIMSGQLSGGGLAILQNVIPSFAVGELDVPLTGLSPAQLTALLAHIFQNADMPYIGDAAGLLKSATAGNLYVSLHTANPAASDDQTNNEVSTANYTNYVRIAVARSAAGWDVA
jgi:hypothetical protein